jgi:hypothetical protein
MKTNNFKKIMLAVLVVALALATVFAISSCTKEHTHEFESTELKAPTCTEDGLAHNVCACGYEEDAPIPALGHTLVHHDRVYASCTQPGCLPYDECTVCGWNDFFEVAQFPHIPGTPKIENEVAVKDTLFTHRDDFCVDSLAFIPFCGDSLIMESTVKTVSGVKVPLFEASMPFKSLLRGLNNQLRVNLDAEREDQGKYKGLQVGSISAPNNNAGNWE